MSFSNNEIKLPARPPRVIHGRRHSPRFLYLRSAADWHRVWTALQQVIDIDFLALYVIL